ncbi:MAG TPA: hypothetical protein VNY30_07730, partial [Bryobacteraceae bacterium]|nr:hypothetical protein [Bryobacteraceae bacterium]
MQGRNHLKLLLWVTGLFIALLTAGCLLLPRGMTVAVVSDTFGTLLIVCAMLAFTWNAQAAKGRVRWFWMLQAAGWA